MSNLPSLDDHDFDEKPVRGMPVGRVEFSASPPAGFPADAAGAAMLIAKHFKADPESRIAAAVAEERERLRLELLAEIEFREEHAKAFPLGRHEPGGLYDLARADALRDFARRLEAP